MMLGHLIRCRTSALERVADADRLRFPCLSRSLLPPPLAVLSINPCWATPLRRPPVPAGMDCPRVRYPQFNDVVEADLADQGYKVLTEPSEQVRPTGRAVADVCLSVCGRGVTTCRPEEAHGPPWSRLPAGRSHGDAFVRRVGCWTSCQLAAVLPACQLPVAPCQVRSLDGHDLLHSLVVRRWIRSCSCTR